jgi:hypothetical protein
MDASDEMESACARDALQPRCRNEYCDSPMHQTYHVIPAATSAGGRDWRELVGMTLCHPCYCRYRDNGTLVRSRECEPRARQHEGFAVKLEELKAYKRQHGKHVNQYFLMFLCAP